MSSTPEGKVKDRIRDLLDGYEGLWQYWPVPSGYGRKTVDILGCYRGRFFAIEAKADGKQPTELQLDELRNVNAAGGSAFVIVGQDSPVLAALKRWLDNMGSVERHDTHLAPAQGSYRKI
jgi:hypothetical protein